MTSVACPETARVTTSFTSAARARSWKILLILRGVSVFPASAKQHGAFTAAVSDERKTCVAAVGDFEEPSWDGRQGSYGGLSLFLLDDGRMAIGSRGGGWDGARRHRDVDFEIVYLGAALTHFQPAEILAGVREALLQQVYGKKPQKPRDAKAIAAKLAAILMLLER